MKTQEDIILSALKRESMHPTTIVAETGILQYNARINGLRKRFGCIHKHGSNACPASEHIINTKLHNGTTLFTYRKDNKNEEWNTYLAKKKQEKQDALSQVSLF